MLIVYRIHKDYKNKRPAVTLLVFVVLGWAEGRHLKASKLSA